MASREHDYLVELLHEKHDAVLTCIKHVLAGEAPVRALGDERKLLVALATTESTVLQPAFERVTLRPDMARLLEDCEGDRDAQLAALDGILHSRSARIRKLRAAELIDLLQQHNERYVGLLIPVLHSQLPRAFYRALANAFATLLDERLTGTPRNGNVSSAVSPAAGLRASQQV